MLVTCCDLSGKQAFSATASSLAGPQSSVQLSHFGDSGIAFIEKERTISRHKQPRQFTHAVPNGLRTSQSSYCEKLIHAHSPTCDHMKSRLRGFSHLAATAPMSKYEKSRQGKSAKHIGNFTTTMDIRHSGNLHQSPV